MQLLIEAISDHPVSDQIITALPQMISDHTTPDKYTE